MNQEFSSGGDWVKVVRKLENYYKYVCLLPLWMGIVLLAVKLAHAEQTAIMRWDASCIHLTEKSYAEAPMKDGQPDYSQTKLHGLKLDTACGMIRVSK